MIHLEGAGWRLAWDDSRKKFPILIGGDGWAFELTDGEWKSLINIVFELTKEYQEIKDQLFDEEKVSLEMGQESWWACIEGIQDNWTLQIILQITEGNARGIEAFWPISAAPNFVVGMRTMWDSYQ